MAQPASIINDRGQSTDTIYTKDLGGRIKLGIGTIDVGEDEDAAYQGVATALDDEEFTEGDGVVVVAGVDGTGTVRHAFIDENGLTHVLAGVSGIFTDASGSIPVANTSEEILAEDANRKYLFIQNVGTEDIWINFTSDASSDPGSIQLSPGAALEQSGIVTSEAVNVFGPESAPFTCKAL